MDVSGESLPEFTDGKPVMWVFTGDSITQGLMHTAGLRGYVEHFHERVRGELARLDDCVVNTGVSGSRAGELVAAFDERVARFRPTIVSVLLGTNDATEGPAGREGFRRHLVTILAAIRDIGATPLLHTPPPIDVDGAPTRADLVNYAHVVREAAEDGGVRLVDHHARWLEARWDAEQDWLADPFHPNGRGHLEMAKTLLRELALFDPASPVCALELP
jgi:lysophospholipase L1-like esterase